MANADVTLAVGSAITVVIAVVYIAALYGLMKNLKWGPTLVAVISVVNRAVALVIFLISPAYLFWLMWTVILLIFAYLDMRNQPAAAAPSTAPA